MATVSRKVCDVDQREDDVVAVKIEFNGKGGTVDLCDKCRGSVPVAQAHELTRKEARRRKAEFVKISLPPQP